MNYRRKNKLGEKTDYFFFKKQVFSGEEFRKTVWNGCVYWEKNEKRSETQLGKNNKTPIRLQVYILNFKSFEGGPWAGNNSQDAVFCREIILNFF